MKNQRSLNEVQSEFFAEMGNASDWCQQQYDDIFSCYFDGVSDIYESVVSKHSKLTDSDLEWILTSIPLQMMSASEQLSQYKLNSECLKLYIKKMESEAVVSSEEKTMSAKREEASLAVMDYKLLLSAYSSVISRVDNEINFARELIMSAKKIWDSRTKTYESNPIGPVDLEDFSMDGKDS